MPDHPLAHADQLNLLRLPEPSSREIREEVRRRLQGFAIRQRARNAKRRARSKHPLKSRGSHA